MSGYRYIALAILSLAFTQPAGAASKTDVGARGCMSLEQARAKHPNAHLYYRKIQSDKCWYDPAEYTAKKSAPKVRVAGEGAVPSTLAAESRATPSVSVRGQPATRNENIDDELDNIFLVLCGGPCPQNAKPPVYLLKHR